MPPIRPSNPQYKPEWDLTVPGQYLAECTHIRYGMPNRKYADGKPLMAIEFRVDDPDEPQLRGKRVSIVCSESIYKDPETKRESHLLTHCRMMGAKSPEQGVDPDQFIGRWFRIQVEEAEGRCFVRVAMPTRGPERNGVNAMRSETPLPPANGVEGDVPF